MPVTVNHVLSATTPDNTSYEIRPSHWNSTHQVTLSAVGSEVIGAFSNGGNVSFGLDGGGHITGSVSASTASINVSAGTTSANLSNLVFSNSNNISFGLGGSTITGSVPGISSLYATGAASLTTLGGSITVGAPVLSVGISGGNTLGNTGTVSKQFVLAGGANVTLSGSTNSAGMTVTLSGATVAGAPVNFSAGTTSSNLSSVVFSNSNNISFGLNGGTITGSVAPGGGASSLDVYVVSNATGQSSSSTYPLSSFQMAGKGFISIGNSAGILQVSSPDSIVFTQLSVGNSTGGHNAGDSGVVTAQLVLAGGANITLSGSTNAGSMTLSIAGGAGGGGGVAISASNTVFTSGTVSLSVAAGAMTIGSGAQAVKFSVPATSSIVGTGLVSLFTTGSTISIGASAAQTNQTQASGGIAGTGFTTATTAGTALVGTQDTNGLSLGVPKWITTAGAGGGVAIAASNTTFTSGTVAFVTAGGAITIGSGAQSVNFSVPGTSSLSATGIVSLSTNGSTVSIGVAPLTVSNSAGSFTASQVLFSNANNVTFGTSAGNIITASVAAPVGGNITVSAGANSSGLASLIFANSNNVSFGLTTGSQVTATATFAQSVQTQASGNIPRTGFSTTSTAGALLVGTHDTAGLSLGVPAWISTYVAQTVQTQASGDIPRSGFTTTTAAGVVIAGTHDTAGLKLGVPGFITTWTAPAAQTTQTQAAGDIARSGFTTGASVGSLLVGTLNSGGLSLSVPPWITTYVAQTVQTQASGNIARTGFSTTTTAGVSLVGTHDTAGLSLGVPAWITTQTVQTQASGNIPRSGFTTNATAGSVLVGTHDTAGLNLGVPAWITTYASQTVQTQASGNIARTGVTTGATAGSTLAATLDTAGLSLGVPAWLTAAGGVQTGISSVVVGATTYTSGQIQFFNSNNFTFLSTTGQGIVGSFSTSQSVQTQASGNIARTGFSTTSTAGSVLVGTHDTAGLSLGVPAWLTVAAGGAGVAIAASDTTFTSGTVVMSAAAGAITIGSGAQSVNFSVPATSSLSATGIVSLSTNGSTISIGASQSVQTQASGNIPRTGFSTTSTAGVSLVGTHDTAGLSLGVPSWITTYVAQTVQTQASGSIAGTGFSTTSTGGSVLVGTHDTGGLSLNVPNWITTYVAQSVQTQAAGGIAGTNTATTGNIAVTLNTSGISINAGNLAGTGTAITGKALITLNSTGLSFNGTSLAGTGTSVASTTGNYSLALNSTGLTLSVPYRTRVIWPDQELTAVSAPTNASMSFVYFPVYTPITGTRLDMLIGMSFSTTAGAGTQSFQQSAYAVIYTKNAASLSSMSSGSTQTTWTMASNTAGQTQLSQAAIRAVSVPMNFNIPPGEYYIGVNYITAATAVSMTHSMYGGNDIQTVSNVAEMASTTNATTGQLCPGMGCYSVASTGMPAALSISAILQTGTNLSAANIALVFRNA